jgi:iron complex outermembrane receptor protein
MKINHFVKFFFLFIIFSASLYSRPVKGVLIDIETNKPVANAAVQIIGLNRFTTSDSSGIFNFGELNLAVYTIKVSHVAYKEFMEIIDSKKISSKQNLILYLIPKVIEISTVVISDRKSTSLFDDMNELTGVLKGKTLQKDLSQNLASTLKNETGLAVRSMGPAPARPVIRGLGGDRVFISEDGVKTIDLSATSPDHAVTIEPFSSERIEVIRGPKVLTKSSNSFGGIVNIIKNEIPDKVHDSFYGTSGFYIESANKGKLGDLSAEIPLSPVAVKLNFSKRKTSDLSTPIGTLNNSSSENLNFSGGANYFFGGSSFGASFNNYELDYGVPGGFVGAHPNGVDISMFRRQLNTRLNYILPNCSFDKFDLGLTGTVYRHQEFESSGKIGSEFRIENYSGYLEFHNNEIKPFSEGIIGVSSDYRKFTAGGYVFTSPTNSLNIAGYIFQEIHISEKLHLESSLRFSYDNISPLRKKQNSAIGAIKELDFYNLSASFSGLIEISPKVFIGANISKTSRTPTIEELFSEGPHLAAYSYEIGNPNLKSESGYGGEFFAYHKFGSLFFHLSFYGNYFTNYIIPRNSGEINYATFLPIYVTSGVEAKLYGSELQAELYITEKLKFTASGSYTIGELENGSPLPQIPPLKGLIELSYASDQLITGISIELANSQKKLDQFEEYTAGYAVANAFVQYSFESGETIHNMSLTVDNILNKEYRNHLSRVKSIMPEAGRNFRLTYKLYFHI